MSGPGAFRESSLHKSLPIPAVVIVMQSIGLYGGGSRWDAVSLSGVGVTLENTEENCLFRACALVNDFRVVHWVSLGCNRAKV